MREARRYEGVSSLPRAAGERYFDAYPRMYALQERISAPDARSRSQARFVMGVPLALGVVFFALGGFFSITQRKLLVAFGIPFIVVGACLTAYAFGLITGPLALGIGMASVAIGILLSFLIRSAPYPHF